MRGNIREKFVGIITVFLLLTIMVGGVATALPKFRRGRAIRQQNNELQERIERKRREIAKLVENQQRFRADSDFVELIARQNHRVFPGELVFVFEKE